MAEFNDNLWAPWRMEYIRSLDQEAEEAGGCFLCRYFERPENDRKNHVVWRGDRAFVVMNRFPYTNGHLMVAVNRHVGDPTELADEELAEMTRLSFACTELLTKAVCAQGCNIGTNIGRCAGAGLPDHLHTHVVPRWNGDTNYMAVLGGVRVVPDGLKATYEQLVSAAVEMRLRDE